RVGVERRQLGVAAVVGIDDAFALIVWDDEESLPVRRPLAGLARDEQLVLAGSVRVDRVDHVLLESRVEAGERDEAVVAARPRRRRARAQGDDRGRGNHSY